MRRYRSNYLRLDRTPTVITFVLLLLLDPNPAPAFVLDDGSDRTISTNAFIFASKANTKEVFIQHLGTTK